MCILNETENSVVNKKLQNNFFNVKLGKKTATFIDHILVLF